MAANLKVLFIRLGATIASSAGSEVATTAQSGSARGETTDRPRRSPIITEWSLKALIVWAWLMVATASISVTVGLAGESPTPPQRGRPDRANVVEIERLIVQRTNAQRVAMGLKPLVVSPALDYLAVEQTRHTCQQKRLEHESDKFPKGWRTFEERLKLVKVNDGGENLASRTEGPAEKWATHVVSGWMDSPNHRKNILSPSFKYIGVGIVACSNRLVYATQVFSSEPGQTPKH